MFNCDSPFHAVSELNCTPHSKYDPSEWCLQSIVNFQHGCWCVQILLVTQQGDVLEGTQTNFFAVIDNRVHTAREGVLMGTVRGVLLEVCGLATLWRHAVVGPLYVP